MINFVFGADHTQEGGVPEKETMAFVLPRPRPPDPLWPSVAHGERGVVGDVEKVTVMCPRWGDPHWAAGWIFIGLGWYYGDHGRRGSAYRSRVLALVIDVDGR